ncbi:MAG: protein kinase [Acidobacteriia bacterium]|nr:protein kinase [Terriglobia bacterium]
MFEVQGTIRYHRTGVIGIGEGMNSTVYRAFDPYLQRAIAVKVVSKAKFGNDFNSYCNEARAMFAAADSNIVGIEYVCETSDDFHLALPLFENGSLKARIEQHPLGLKNSLKVAQGGRTWSGTQSSYTGPWSVATGLPGSIGVSAGSPPARVGNQTLEISKDDPRTAGRLRWLERADRVGQVWGSSPHGPTISAAGIVYINSISDHPCFNRL